jgi:eukaryotic-like serine/threonine-protein kinase
VGGWLVFSRKAHALTDNDTIVLSDFTNTTGDTVFDGTLRQGLSVQLEQSPFLSIISDEKIQQTLGLMGQPVDAKLIPAIAREVCQRTSSAAVLDGSIAKIGTQYLLTLKAVNCESGKTLASTQARARDKDHVLDVLGWMASEIRSKLGESLGSVQKFDVPLEQATTPLLEALQAYSAGVAALKSKGETAALPLFKRAVDLDPNFAMAYARIAGIYYNLSEMALAAKNATTAYTLRRRATERERLFIDSRFYGIAEGDVERETQVYEQWKQAYPRDSTPYTALAGNETYLGRYGECLRISQQALQLDPDTTSNYANLIVCYIAIDKLDEAQTALSQARHRKLESPSLVLEAYLLALRRDDHAEMERALSAGGRRGTEHFLLSTQADTEAFHGHLIKAREFSRRAVASAIRDDAKETAAVWHLNAALREAEFGIASQAKRCVTDGLALANGAYEAGMGALALARTGDITKAMSIVKDVSVRFPNDTVLNNYWLPSVRAAVELNRKNSVRAIEALRVAIPYELGQVPPLDVIGPMYPIYLRGEAYLMERNGLAAAAEFKRILEHAGIVLNFPLAALTNLQIGRAYALAGDTPKAKVAYESFFALWKDADPDIPILKQAKAEYAKLQ